MAQTDKDMVYFAKKYPRLFRDPNDVKQRWFCKILKTIFIENENELEKIDEELNLTGGLDQNTGVFSMVSPNTSKRLWSFTHRTALDKIKLIIIGQDPYPPMFGNRKNEFESDGLAFSTIYPGRELPDYNVLKRIFDAIREQFKDDPNLDLSRWTLDNWAEQGVLLLNTGLTLGNRSHIELWKNITKEIVSRVCQHVWDQDKQHRPVVVLLWGYLAKENFSGIPSSFARILESRHPSKAADNYYGQFANNNRDFINVNEILKKMGKLPIDWSTVPEDERNGQSDINEATVENFLNDSLQLLGF